MGWHDSVANPRRSVQEVRTLIQTQTIFYGHKDFFFSLAQRFSIYGNTERTDSE
jgi:hypothetical protein